MAITHGYATGAQAVSRFGTQILGATDANLERSIEAASRIIDRYCGRRFWKDTGSTLRFYSPEDPYDLPVDDVADDATFTVVSGEPGTWADTWTRDAYTSNGFILSPENRDPGSSGDADLIDYPFNRLEVVSGALPLGRRTVKITSTWGWPVVPKQVEEACLLLVNRLWKRKDAPWGAAGMTDVAIVRFTDRLDPDVRILLDDLRRFDTPVA